VWNPLALAPITYVFFRPEEENRCSSEYDVIPPARGGNRQMKHALITSYSTVNHR